jgi:putative hemolysin
MSDPAPDGNIKPSLWQSITRRLSRNADPVTEEDILQLVDAGEETGVIEETQKDMIANIFEFGDITAEEIMTPRTDVEALDLEDPISEALRIGVEHGFSRIPVYEEDIDHVKGVLYIKDLLPYVGRELPADLTLRTLMREAFFVPGSKNCQDLFSEMTEKHIQLAMVVDEYGGLAGIVTMEDLLESIVGNIQDEYDHEEEEIVQTGDNSFEVDASLSVDEVSELVGITLPEGDYDTLAGFLIYQLGRIPDANENPSVEYEGLTFTVLEMEDRRIGTVHIEKRPETEE